MLMRKLSAPVPTQRGVAALRALARAEDRSVSSLIRRAIREYLSNNRQSRPAQSSSAKIDDGTG